MFLWNKTNSELVLAFRIYLSFADIVMFKSAVKGMDILGRGNFAKKENHSELKGIVET